MSFYNNDFFKHDFFKAATFDNSPKGTAVRSEPKKKTKKKAKGKQCH